MQITRQQGEAVRRVAEQVAFDQQEGDRLGPVLGETGAGEEGGGESDQPGSREPEPSLPCMAVPYGSVWSRYPR